MNAEKIGIVAALAGMTLLIIAEPAHAGVNPLPEPGTLVLLGAGAAAVGAVAWWRRRK